MEETYYDSLIKPAFAPPSEVFGIVWSILYPVIIISFGYVFYLLIKKEISFRVALPFILNIIFNVLFTPVQFGLQNNLLALIVIVLVVATLIWAMITIYEHKPWVMYVQIPYLIWVIIATILQISITALNWGV